MTKCIQCGSDCAEEWNYIISEVKGYKEVSRERTGNSGLYDNGEIRRVTEKAVLLDEPESELTGGVCKSCLRKPKGKNLIGIGLTLLSTVILLIFYGNVLAQFGKGGSPLEVLFQGGIFVTLVLALIFALPFFRNVQTEISDQFFLKARADKEEPVLGLQELSYYYGKKQKHYLMLRKSHWEELEKEEDLRILTFL